MSSFFTGAMVLAICLFVGKEILEFVRRRAADGRKLQAYKCLLADEMEKNNWVVRALRNDLKALKEDWASSVVTIKVTPTGMTRLHITNDDGETRSVIPNVSRTIFAKLVTDIAVLDKDLFIAAIAAYEAVSELEHVRNSLVEFVSNEDEGQGFRESFLDFAFSEVADAYIHLAALYKICTDNDLQDHKLRSFA